MLTRLKNYSILYVEDEPEIQKNIAEYLKNHFGAVYIASTGNEALIAYTKKQPDVVLLDINLPDIDGLSVATKIREDDSETKIIMLTAYTDKEKLLKATELKLSKYLVKPVAPKVFKETLKLLAEELSNKPTRLIKLCQHCIWDDELEQLDIDNKQVSLAEKENRLLKLFIKNRGKVVSFERIMAELWEDSFDREISIDSVKNQVSKLRKKLPLDCISNVYGEGYLLKITAIH